MTSAAVILAVAIVLVVPLWIGATVWRRPLLMSLPFLAALNGLAIPLGRSSVRVDQLAACALASTLVAAVLMRRRRLVLDAASLLVLAMLALNVGASIVHSPARTYSVLQCVNL